MGKKAEIFVVHAYEAFRGGKLGVLSEAVCKKVAKIHARYTLIIMVGGWHLDIGSRPTLGELMKNRLVKLGVPDYKIVTQFSFGERLARHMPSRDTAEETDWTALILRALGKPPRETAIDVAGIWFFLPRMKLFYKARGAEVNRFVSVCPFKSLFMRKRIWGQIRWYLKARTDPMGEGPDFQQNRLNRTLGDPDEYLPIKGAWNK